MELTYTTMSGEERPLPNHGRDTWLIQRLNKPKGYKNPWGDVNNEVTDVNIAKVIDPQYMGAAEYEFGTYRNCIDVMLKHGTTQRAIYIYPNNENIPVHIVSSKGCEDIEVDEQIRFLYLEPSRILHKTGDLPNRISKADYCSFYKACRKAAVCNFKDIKTDGWLNVKKFYAFFIKRELAESFNNYCNQAKEVAV